MKKVLDFIKSLLYNIYVPVNLISFNGTPLRYNHPKVMVAAWQLQACGINNK